MLRFPSILSRIVVLHVIAVVITSVLMSIALSWLLSISTKNIHNRAMQDEATAIADQLRVQPGGRLSLELSPELQALYAQPSGRYVYAVVDTDGRVLFSSLRNGNAPFPNAPRNADVAFMEATRPGAALSGANLRRVLDDRVYWIQAGEDLANRGVLIDDIVSVFFRRVGWITLPILLVLLVTDILIFRRALQPLRTASDIASSIGPERTDLRLPTARIPREVQPLVQAVNQALDRLEQGFRMQRDFTADAAHELRTPLAILRTRLEALDDETGKALRRDVDGMARIIGQLLDIAELDAISVSADAKADLHAVATEVIEQLAPLAVAEGREIGLSGTETSLWVHGDHHMLAQALRNLGENALRHTPRGGSVEFVIGRDGSLAVQDEGPGIPASEREVIFRRFWRGDRSKPGRSGLGLAIVRRICELNGGTVEVDPACAKGARFVMRLRPSELPAQDHS